MLLVWASAVKLDSGLKIEVRVEVDWVHVQSLASKIGNLIVAIIVSSCLPSLVPWVSLGPDRLRGRDPHSRLTIFGFFLEQAHVSMLLLKVPSAQSVIIACYGSSKS